MVSRIALGLILSKSLMNSRAKPRYAFGEDWQFRWENRIEKERLHSVGMVGSQPLSTLKLYSTTFLSSLKTNTWLS